MTWLILLLPMFSWAGALDGTWRQDCRQSHEREETFFGNGAVYREINFRDKKCALPSVEIVTRGEISLGGTAVDPEGAIAIDFIYNSVAMRPRDQAAADAYESRQLCGLRGWKVNEELDITGRDCDLFGLGNLTRVPAAGERKYGIVKWNESELFFGQLSLSRDGNAPERRPQLWDTSPYRKQP